MTETMSIDDVIAMTPKKRTPEVGSVHVKHVTHVVSLRPIEKFCSWTLVKPHASHASHASSSITFHLTFPCPLSRRF